MSTIEDVKSLSPLQIGLVLFGACATACPGVLWLWHFSPALVKEEGSGKILLLAMSFTLPLACINSFVVALIDRKAKQEVDASLRFFGLLIVGSLFTMAELLVSLLIVFWSDLSLSSSVVVVVVVWAMVPLVVLVRSRWQSP